MRNDQDPDPRLERAARQLSGLDGEQGREVSYGTGKARPPYPEWVPGVFETFRKVFAPARFNQEQEKRIKYHLGRARNMQAALDAIDLMYNEEVRYPQGFEVRLAIARVNQQVDDATPRWEEPTGPWISFSDWFALQDEAMKDRVRRVFPSLEVTA